MRKILIVEDNILVAYLLEEYLNEAGCFDIVGSVINGSDAIAISKVYKPDLILMDVRIEGDKDGIDTANEINMSNRIPIIYITGNSDNKTTERAKNTNMLGFLAKPVIREELINLIYDKLD